jgi:hypothetical protein
MKLVKGKSEKMCGRKLHRIWRAAAYCLACLASLASLEIRAAAISR